MRRILLISLALWSIANAIPEKDLKLIKEVQQLTEDTYKKALPAILSFNMYKAQLVLDCEVLSGNKLEEWQNYFDNTRRISKERNLTADEIERFVNKLEEKKDNYQTFYINQGTLLHSLHICTNGTYDERRKQYAERIEGYLKPVESELIAKMLEISEYTKQKDPNLFAAFDNFVKAEKATRESNFRVFRNKISIRYEDRIILTEIRALEEEVKRPYFINMFTMLVKLADCYISCRLGNETYRNEVQNYIEDIRNNKDNLTNEQLLNITKTIDNYILPKERNLVEPVLNRLSQCTHETLNEMESKNSQLYRKSVLSFKEKVIPRIMNVSVDTKSSLANATLFYLYNSFVNRDDFDFMDAYCQSFVSELKKF